MVFKGNRSRGTHPSAAAATLASGVSRDGERLTQIAEQPDEPDDATTNSDDRAAIAPDERSYDDSGHANAHHGDIATSTNVVVATLWECKAGSAGDRRGNAGADKTGTSHGKRVDAGTWRRQHDPRVASAARIMAHDRARLREQRRGNKRRADAEDHVRERTSEWREHDGFLPEDRLSPTAGVE